MIGRNRASQLAGVSACALGAAVVLMSGEAAAACTATFNEEAVTVICPVEGVEEFPSAPFRTSFSSEGPPYTGNGADQLTVNGGTIVLGGVATPVTGFGANLDPGDPVTSVQMLDGDDVVDINSGTVAATIELGAGDDNIDISVGTVGADGFTGTAIDFGSGADHLDMFSGTVNGSIASGAGDTAGDMFHIFGGAITGGITGSDFVDDIDVSGGTVGGVIDARGGDDEVIVGGDDTSVADVRGGAGADSIWIGIQNDEGVFYSSPTTGVIFGDAGDDMIAAAGGTIAGVDGGAGDDKLYAGPNEPTGIAASVGFMSGGDGNDLLHVFNDGGVSGLLDGGAGNDDIRVGRSLDPVNGADEFLGGGTVGSINAGAGDDDIFVWDDADDETPAGGVFGTINAGAGNDDLTISGTGTVGNSETVAAVLFGAGVDTLTLSGGTVNGSIFGQGGNGAGSGNVFNAHWRHRQRDDLCRQRERFRHGERRRFRCRCGAGRLDRP